MFRNVMMIAVILSVWSCGADNQKLPARQTTSTPNPTQPVNPTLPGGGGIPSVTTSNAFSAFCEGVRKVIAEQQSAPPPASVSPLATAMKHNQVDLFCSGTQPTALFTQTLPQQFAFSGNGTPVIKTDLIPVTSSGGQTEVLGGAAIVIGMPVTDYMNRVAVWASQPSDAVKQALGSETIPGMEKLKSRTITNPLSNLSPMHIRSVTTTAELTLLLTLTAKIEVAHSQYKLQDGVAYLVYEVLTKSYNPSLGPQGQETFAAVLSGGPNTTLIVTLASVKANGGTQSILETQIKAGIADGVRANYNIAQRVLQRNPAPPAGSSTLSNTTTAIGSTVIGNSQGNSTGSTWFPLFSPR